MISAYLKIDTKGSGELQFLGKASPRPCAGYQAALAAFIPERNGEMVTLLGTIVSDSLNDLFAWMASWSDAAFYIYPHLALLLVALTVVLALSLTAGSNSVGIQILVGVICVLVVGPVRLDVMGVESGAARTWLLIPSLIAIAFLPRVVPRLLLPRRPQQELGVQICYSAVALLLLLNFIQVIL